MDRRTVITLGIILAVVFGGLAFVVFNTGARDAMQKNLDTSTKQAADEARIKSR